jgi:hypothetical protein
MSLCLWFLVGLFAGFVLGGFTFALLGAAGRPMPHPPANCTVITNATEHDVQLVMRGGFVVLDDRKEDKQ